MAYPHTEYEVLMTTSRAVVAGGNRGGHGTIALGTGGTAVVGKGRWSPGLVPHVIRNVAVIPLTTAAFVTAPVISFRTCNSGATTTATGNQITSVTLATAASSGKAFYKSTYLNSAVSPGTDVVAVTTTLCTVNVVARIVLYVEPKWETPANNSRMVAG